MATSIGVESTARAAHERSADLPWLGGTGRTAEINELLGAGRG